MIFESIASRAGNRCPAAVRSPRAASRIFLVAVAIVSGGNIDALGAPPAISALGSGLKAVSRAASKALGGKPKDATPKQASRLPLPPDANVDDEEIRKIARPPLAEGGDATAAEGTAPAAAKKAQKPSTSPSSEPSSQVAPIGSIDDLMAFAASVSTSARTIVTASLDPSYPRSAGTSGLSVRHALHSGGKSPPTANVTAKKNTAARKNATEKNATEKETAQDKTTKNGARPNQAGDKPQADEKAPGELMLAPASVRHPAGSWTAEGSANPPPKNQRLDRLRKRIAQTLAVYKRRPLNTQDHTPWEVMHSFLAYGIGTEVRVGGPRGGFVNAIGWVNSGGRCHGQTMLATDAERVFALKGVGVQGHSAQYLAILAQCRVAANSPLTPQKTSFTVADLIEQEKLDCKSKTELTFALIGLAHYLPTDAEWTSRDGQSWSLQRLVAEELEQPIRGAPCGGSHRLFGLAYGCQRRLRATGSLEGVYARADVFVRDYQLMTLTKLQNPDGSFSTEWYKFPTAQNREDDIDRKIQTTGHMLEWLVASLDQDSIYHGRVIRAVEFLTWALASEPDRAWAIGPMCHALHALSVYQERVWGEVLPGAVAAFKGPMKAVPERALELAEKPKTADSASRDEPDDGASGTKTSRQKPAVRR